MGHAEPLVLHVKDYTTNGVDIGFKLAEDATVYLLDNRKRGGRVILDFEGVKRFAGQSAIAFYDSVAANIETYCPLDYISFTNRNKQVANDMKEAEEVYNAIITGETEDIQKGNDSHYVRQEKYY